MPARFSGTSRALHVRPLFTLWGRGTVLCLKSFGRGVGVGTADGANNRGSVAVRRMLSCVV